MEEKSISVLAFAGSLRTGSYNRAALRVAEQNTPEGVTITIFDLKGIPLYDGDVEKNEGFPDEVAAFREAVKEADALLIATPEYNRGVTGVLKNALDWASRREPDGTRIMSGKPVAYLGASDGGFGTARAQRELAGLATVLGMHVYTGGPEVLISKADTKFTPDGVLLDATIEESISQLLVGLQKWTLQLQK